MLLSEAIEQNINGIEDTPGRFFAWDSIADKKRVIAACAIGHACINAGYVPDPLDVDSNYIGGLFEKFPVLETKPEWLFPGIHNVYWQIIRWYDNTGLTRAEIAGRLREHGL
jgi:hypothetical protein